MDCRAVGHPVIASSAIAMEVAVHVRALARARLRI
jgi:hypothetical protein